MEEKKRCQWCETILVKRADETDWNFKKRKCCNQKHASLLREAKKGVI